MTRRARRYADARPWETHAPVADLAGLDAQIEQQRHDRLDDWPQHLHRRAGRERRTVAHGLA